MNDRPQPPERPACREVWIPDSVYKRIRKEGFEDGVHYGQLLFADAMVRGRYDGEQSLALSVAWGWPRDKLIEMTLAFFKGRTLREVETMFGCDKRPSIWDTP
jgi:hypothetical protein